MSARSTPNQIGLPGLSRTLWKTRRTPSASSASGTRSRRPAETPPEIETLDWAGSADLRTVASADGFAAFPAGDRDYNPGEIVDFLPMR